MSRIKISRREFVRGAAVAAAGVAVVACQPQTVVVEKVVKETVQVEKVVKETVQVEKEVTKVVAVTKIVEKMVEVTAVPKQIKESPLSYGQVASGKLPPVEERLPAEPLVLVRADGFTQEIGTFGGVIQLLGEAEPPLWEYLLMLNRLCLTTLPCIVRGWEFAPDGKSVTFMFRKGAKWSDGQPFTADDIVFWWEDDMLNKDLFPNTISWYVSDKEPMKVEKVDDYTIKFSFKLPYWAFIHQRDSTGYRGAQFHDENFSYTCMHYAKQFHPKYNPDAAAKAKAAGYDNWNTYYKYMCRGVAAGLPLMAAWTKDAETPTGDTGARNPYYFKVDSEGNQLPYIDSYNRSRRGDPETRVLQITAGQVDFEGWGLVLSTFPVLKSSEDKGGYDVWLGVDMWPAATQMAFNHCYNKDKQMGELLNNAQFRRALSVAIDRDAINESQFLGYGRPVQVTVMNDTPWYKEAWGKAYAQYDVKQANAWLDEIGLNKKDAEGFRTFADGKKLTLIVDVCNAVGFWIPTSEMVKGYWEAVGVRTVLNDVGGDLIWQRQGSNEQQVWVWCRDATSYTMINLRTDTLWWTFQEYSTWWFSKDTATPTGIEPPDDIKKLYQAQDNWSHFDDKQLAAAVDVIWGDQAENVRCIGTGAPGGQPCITKKKLGNVDMKAHADAYDIGGIRNNWLETFFWKA